MAEGSRLVIGREYKIIAPIEGPEEVVTRVRYLGKRNGLEYFRDKLDRVVEASSDDLPLDERGRLVLCGAFLTTPEDCLSRAQKLAIREL